MLLSLGLKWLIVAAAFYITAELLPGVRVKSFGTAMIAAAIFGLATVLLGWLLFIVLGIGTLGVAWVLAFITWWVIDAVLLLLTDKLVDDFKLDGFGSALMASGLIALLSAVGHWLVTHIL